MLSQIQFKLNVEEQYLKGVEKMVQLYGMEGDRKSKADAAARRVESKQKIVLLKQALKRYEELHIDVDSADNVDGRQPSREAETHANCIRRFDQHAKPPQAVERSARHPNHGTQGR